MEQDSAIAANVGAGLPETFWKKLPELCQGHIKYTYIGYLHFASASNYFI